MIVENGEDGYLLGCNVFCFDFDQECGKNVQLSKFRTIGAVLLTYYEYLLAAHDQFGHIISFD